MNNQEKRKIFQAHLQEQNRRREEILEQKKKQDSKKSRPQQDMLYIQKTFRQKQKIVQQNSVQYKKKEITFEPLQASYLQLKQYYIDISYVLMTYDRQFYKEILEKINNNIIDLKNKLEPRKRFKFSRRDEDFGVKKDAELVVKMQAKKQTHGIAIPGVSGKHNEIIKIQREKSDTTGSYKIVECKDCQISLNKNTEILFLKELKNCKINCALTKSTVFVDNCENCTFQLNCHQLRIHNTSKTTFCIFVTSKAIIEDCNEVIFTPYNYKYPEFEKDIDQFERKQQENKWRSIQDFNWLKENQKSPHFELRE